MSYALANIPPVSCYVRREYLRDFQDGYGEFTPAYWVTVKAIRARALYIEAFLPEYGALYDKLPISAFVWKPETPKPDLKLGDLQLWDAISPQLAVVEKAVLKNMRCKFRTPAGVWSEGHYLFTVDMVHSDPNEIDANWARVPSEHKSYNFMRLDNGQFAAQPNNRVLWLDEALVYKETKMPDFKVSTREFSAEGARWRLGDSDAWGYDDQDKKAEIKFVQPIDQDPIKAMAKTLKVIEKNIRTGSVSD
jgi:hypothetical protein